MQAIKKFDPSRGVRLSTYSAWWIRAYILRFILVNWRIVKLGTTQNQRKLFFNLRKAKKNLGWLSHEETLAVASDLGVSEREVTEMEKRLAARDMSFDPAPHADDDDHCYSPAAYLKGPAPDPAEAVEKSDWQSKASGRLGSAMKQLDERSRDIVMRRWLSDEKDTLQTLADEYSVSAERIRQIEGNAIKTLKSHMAE